MAKNLAARLPSGHIMVTCAKCSSSGINPQTPIQRVSTPANDKALADWAVAVEQTYTIDSEQHNALSALERKHKGDSAKLALLAPKRQQLDEQLKQDLEALVTKRPVDSAYFVVASCPWCKTEMNTRIDEPKAA